MNIYLNKLTLLYVEDMEETREMFSTLLEDTFKEIILAKDGEEALLKIKQYSIDLIINNSYDSIMVIEKDSLARIGGDEFTLIIEKIKEIKDIQKVTKKLIGTIEKPIYYEDKALTVSASIGISTYPSDTIDRENLLKYADLAMYKAKKHEMNIIYYSQMENM